MRAFPPEVIKYYSIHAPDLINRKATIFALLKKGYKLLSGCCLNDYLSLHAGKYLILHLKDEFNKGCISTADEEWAVASTKVTTINKIPNFK